MKVIDPVKEKAEILSKQGYLTDIGEYIRKGYSIFEKDMGNFIGYTLLVFLIALVSGIIPFASLFVTGPLIAGYYIIARKIDKAEEYEFGDFFGGFDFILQLFIFTLISKVLTVIGLIAFILPGIYLAVAWLFAPFFIVFTDTEFWESMELSRRLITRKWWSFLGLLLIIVLLNVAGAFLFGIGLLFTVPVSYCSIYAAFEDIAGT